MAGFSKKQRLYLYQFCADMLRAELPIYDSLARLRDEGAGLLGTGFTRKLGLFLERMATTESVASVFEGMVPQRELGVIYSSERSGSLADGFLSVVSVMEFEQQLRSRLVRAVTFPLIMLGLALLVIGGYAVKVFPAFESVIPPERWPGVSRSLYSFGSALAGGLWLHILLSLAGLTALTRLMMTGLTGPLRDRVLDRVIPFSAYRRMSASLFLNSLSSMLRNGVPLSESLDVIRLNAGRWMRHHIGRMQENMARGLPYGRAMSTGLLGPAELLNISLYSGLPSFYEVLLAVSGKARQDTAQGIDRLAGILRSLATMVLGGCVIWVFIALYALSDQISKMTAF